MAPIAASVAFSSSANGFAVAEGRDPTAAATLAARRVGLVDLVGGAAGRRPRSWLGRSLGCCQPQFFISAGGPCGGAVPAAAVIMGQAADDLEQMEQLRELIKVLLGIAAVKEDVADIVSDLFKLLHQLEARCPQLSCHFHVSGVSQRTGESFFVVVYDAALMASAEAKRVVKTVYTHLHSEASMVMTSALFRNSLVRLLRAPVGGPANLAVQAAPPPASDGIETVAKPVVPGDLPRGLPPPNVVSAHAAADGPGVGDSPSEKNAEVPHGPNEKKVVEAEDPVAGNGSNETGSPPRSPSASTAAGADAFDAAGVGFAPPDVHVPSEEANEAVEDLFKAVKGGWVGILRSTLAAVLLALVAFNGLPSKAALQGVLVWWPLVRDSRNANGDEQSAAVKKGRRGRSGDRLLPQPYPVEVQRRHNPPSERRRDAGNKVDCDYIILNEVAPGRAHQTDICEVVAALLLLFDKEKAIVETVVDKKLAEHGVARTELHAPLDESAPKSLTVTDVLAREGFSGERGKGQDQPPSETPSDLSAAASPRAIGAKSNEGVSAAVAARLAARRASGVSSQRAAAAHQAAEAAKKALRAVTRNLKRSGAAGTADTPKKRARTALTTRSDVLAAEFRAPNMEPRSEGTSCSVFVEAEMLASHTYGTLATNWPPLELDSREPEFEVLTASNAEWDVILEKQKDVTTVFGEGVVRRARKALMAKMDAVRGSVNVDLQQQPCLYVKIAAGGNVGEVNLTSSALQCMVDLHTASMRVQVFRASVEWLRDVAGYASVRVPDFSGGGHSTNAALASEIVTALLGSHPTSTLWRLTSPTALGADQGVVLPAHLLVSNCQDVCMTDDIITVNSVILARWCVANRPKDFCVLHCSFFSELVSTVNDVGIVAMAEKEYKAAGRATTMISVCNVDNAHWVTLGVHVPSKTVWLYDSGSHFSQLKKKVQAACKQMQLFGKSLHELAEEDELAGEAVLPDAAVASVPTVSEAIAADAVETAKSDALVDAPADSAKDVSAVVANISGGGVPVAASEANGAEAAGAPEAGKGSTAPANTAEGDTVTGAISGADADEAPAVGDGDTAIVPANDDLEGGAVKIADVDEPGAVGKPTAGEQPGDKDVPAGATQRAHADTAADLNKPKDVGEIAGAGEDNPDNRAAEGSTAKGPASTSIVGVVPPVKKKAWTTRRVKAPSQTDSTSCGPFAFSFLWHEARGVEAKVLSCDAFAVRVAMLAAVVRDGSEQDDGACI